ncbi:MAG TPA: DnaJ C-terminal domain-containing protein, partial [Terrimicrobiaceae bacterium]|nr:DnaJ C-terminal domain-containing protein [Terrimicrobiaceae bacterium]
FSVAALGGEVRVPTLTGAVNLKIPPGTQGESVFRIRSQGMPGLQSSSRGDILARVQVEVPTRLNHEQRKALEHFAQLCGEENTPLHKSFTDRLRDLFS